MAYEEEDYLQISGLQHFSFCRRQWALIHIEQQWAENYYTTDGALFHKHAHDTAFQESRPGCITIRGMRVRSASLGISGACDVLEFHQSKEGVALSGRDGCWQPFPIEYKRGKPAQHTEADALQLCAQAMCLEEMLCCEIPRGALYYGEIRHRYAVELTAELRHCVKNLLEEMHALYKRGYTPKGKPTKACQACSLKEQCLPSLMRTQSVFDYIRGHLEEKS